MPLHSSSALRHYQASAATAAVADLSPHQLITLLLAGVLDRLHSAQGCMRAGETTRKLALLASAMAIIDHLRLCLDRAAGDIAHNLDALYEYMGRRLLKANLDNDVKAVEEVVELLRTLKQAWDAIGRSR